jgi:hypothetical protein
MENTNDIIKGIAQTAFDNVPVDNWNKIVAKIAMLTTYNELTVTYYVNDNNKGRSFDADYPGAPKDKRLSRLFAELRKATYALAPNKGAWYNAEMTITESGQFNVVYDYDNKPDFEMTPNDEEYLIDTKEFPRDNESTPPWLREVLPS